MLSKELIHYEKALIQTFEGQFINESAFNLYFAFKNLGLKIESFAQENLPSVIDNNTIVVGSVDVMHQVFLNAGVDIPKPLDIPFELEGFTGRKIYRTTLGGLIEKNEFPIFVKPADRGKLFNGNISTNKYDLELYQHYEERGLALPVIGSEVVNFISEYRCFVLNGKLIDIRRYKGNPTVFPDIDRINGAISDFKSSPISYVLDFGIIQNVTALVEANDFYATGTYGLDALNHAKMFLSRYKQIMQH